MMSLMPWQKLTARMTVKAVAWAEGRLALGCGAMLVAVVSVKAGSEVFLAGVCPRAGLAAAPADRLKDARLKRLGDAPAERLGDGCLISRLRGDFFRGLVQ
ncbi:hypothetical protein X767_18985 [Mesorhizobium sp. LSJC264A00]|nr:hypothetical protein X767_18985 [Mesorhizobium sp. LSJC264A00]